MKFFIIYRAPEGVDEPTLQRILTGKYGTIWQGFDELEAQKHYRSAARNTIPGNSIICRSFDWSCGVDVFADTFNEYVSKVKMAFQSLNDRVTTNREQTKITVSLGTETTDHDEYTKQISSNKRHRDDIEYYWDFVENEYVTVKNSKALVNSFDLIAKQILKELKNEIPVEVIVKVNGKQVISTKDIKE